MFEKLKNSASLATLIVASGLATTAVSTPSQADGWKPAVAPVAETNWAGLYLGSHVGAGQANFNGIYQSTDSAVFPDQLEGRWKNELAARQLSFDGRARDDHERQGADEFRIHL